MADPVFDQISATTLADLRADVVIDNFFVETSLQRKMRVAAILDEFEGGTIMQTVFQYDRVNGGAVYPGSDVSVVQKQILAATAFTPKEYVEQIPLNEFQTQVQNAGPNARVSTEDAYMSNAVQALNTDLEIDMYRHGQASSSLVSDSRPQFVNGVSEAMNDGVNPSWDGNIFTTYGGQTRNGAVGTALNSIPIWVGAQDGSTGQISYKVVLEAYLNAVQSPDFGVCNKALFAYLLERQEPKQNFVQAKDLSIGCEGIKILDAYIHVDKLAPSTKYGQILPSGLSQTTSIQPSAFTTPVLSASQRAISNYPSNTSCSPGEPLFLFRMAGWHVRPSAAPGYDFYFTPPIRSQNNPDLVVIFLRHAINFYTESPRDNSQLIGAGF